MEPFFIYMVKSGGILTIFYLIYKLLLQRETFFISNRIFLIIGILGSILIPFIVFTKTVYIEPLAQNSLDSIVESNTLVSSKKITIWTIFCIVYIVGLIIFLSRFTLQVLSLVKIIKESKMIKVGNYRYVQTKKEISPFSFLNFIVFNPDLHSESNLDIIINHEKIHTHQKHSLDIILVNLFIIFQWVNPVAWLYKKAIEQNLEFLADEKTSQNISCKKSYQYLLLQQVVVNHFSITNTFFNHLIKKRIVMLNKNKSKQQNIWKYALTLPLLVTFIFLFNTKTIAQTAIKEKSANKEEQNIKIKKIDEFKDPLYILNGEKIEEKEFEQINAHSIESINVLKDKSAEEKYGTEGKNGVVEVKTKESGKISIRSINNTDNPIYILDGKKVELIIIQKLSPNKIEKIEVLKGQGATDKYGEDGKNGVIIITTKK